MSAPTGEVKLFEAPDLAALQRNWPRIALRGSILLLVPFLVTMLAKSLDLYATLRAFPLPLDFLDRGPFLYEAKVIFTVVATLLALAFLVPKRTTQLVMAIAVGGILWVGHVYIQLQWARLFATTFNFRRDAAPGPIAWIYATLLLLAAIVFLLMENLLDTREQQDARKLAKEETRAHFDAAWRTLGVLLALGAAFAAVLVGAYLGLRALLAGVTLPFRLNPVFLLLAMGIGLAVLVALAAAKRSPVAGGVALLATAPATAPIAAPVLAAAATPARVPTRKVSGSLVVGLVVVVVTFLVLLVAGVFNVILSFGLATLVGVASVALWRRFARRHQEG